MKKNIFVIKKKSTGRKVEKKRETKAFRFRKSYEWTQKSREIRERPLYVPVLSGWIRENI